MRTPRVQGRQVAIGLATVGLLGCLAWFIQVDHGDLFDPLAGLLAAFALVTNLTAAYWDRSLNVSGSLIAALTAGAFLGPGPAFVVVAVAEVSAWAIQRMRPIALPLNVFGLGAPALAAATVVQALARDGAADGAWFYLVFGLSAVGAIALNLFLVSAILSIHDERPLARLLRDQRHMVGVWSLNVALMVAIASVYATAGLSAAALVLLGILALTYQARLVARAEERTREYASLSWGVLSGMLRAIDMRDGRTARHSAAVASLARDMAAAAGMPERECELAHTAGLLHDVGRFALSDRVMERGVRLTETDWKGIRRHPELGAEMLKDLGVYGPIAEIVRTHHERLDGRGYPNGLTAEDIPEIAKVIAVAEVYDTLTAEDTYRVKLSSFEALNELRRVAGSQLEGRYVEALADVLSGKDVEYRHGVGADFDRELDVERRVGEAASG